MKLRALSVIELNKYIKRIVNSDPILNNVLVKGEVSNIKYHDSGIIYFSLKDEKSKINCVVFREHAINIKFNITNGMKVTVKGNVSTFDRDSSYQIYIKSIEQDGLGDLFIAFDQLKTKLKAEGLFNTEFKKPIPFSPEKIAVVTSPTGAAIRDIISVIKRRNKLIDIVVYPVLVQGINSAAQISQTLNLINQNNDVDVIILSRGGGSIEELWAFNEEVVARSIFNSAIPVISAIGHETDYTISDFVSDLRAPTPSAAAEIVANSIIEIQTGIINLNARLNNIVNRIVNTNRDSLSLLNIEKTSLYLKRKLNEERQSNDFLYKNLEDKMEQYIKELKFKLLSNASKLEVINPFSTLLRGYALVLDNDKDKVVDMDSVKKDDHINIMLSNGVINCKVLNKKREDKFIGKFINQGN